MSEPGIEAAFSHFVMRSVGSFVRTGVQSTTHAGVGARATFTVRWTTSSLRDGSRYWPAPAPATLSTAILRRYSAAASGSTVLMNIPDPSSNPATRVRRGITLTYQ